MNPRDKSGRNVRCAKTIIKVNVIPKIRKKLKIAKVQSQKVHIPMCILCKPRMMSKVEAVKPHNNNKCKVKFDKSEGSDDEEQILMPKSTFNKAATWSHHFHKVTL